MALLTVENVSFTYPGKKEKTIRNVSFQIEKGAFVVLCGATGSGKSTLLRLIKRELVPAGQMEGSIYLDGKQLEALPSKAAAGMIGYVMQRPEQQLVTDRVWHELAFGLENMGVPQADIARRTAEMAAYFGIENWYDQPVSALSGGQKQLLNLASVMVMQPSILILDEPTSQLDPIAANEFITTVRKINQELGLTVIMIEHRLEEVIPCCDEVMVLKRGSLAYKGEPRAVIRKLMQNDASLLGGMPAAVRIYSAMEGTGDIPLNVREGRRFIENSWDNHVRKVQDEKSELHGEPALEMQDVYFRYERSLPDVLRGLNVTVYSGEIFCVLGGNGSGKTTMLTVAAAVKRPYSGKIKVFGKSVRQYHNQSLYRECLTLLPQDVQTVFLRSTVREELCGAEDGVALLPADISHLYDQHPYDLSGGEQQLVALAKVLATKPKLLLMDEPTKGLDYDTKNRFAEILKALKESGVTIVIVTHDVEFASLCADRCAMVFRGSVVSAADTRSFFAENSFYTTAVSRMTRGYFDEAITVDDVLKLLKTNRRREENK